MNQADNVYSTQRITPQLISQIIDALKNKHYGSIEIYVENYQVVQITERTITKMKKAGAHRKISITVNRNAQFTTEQRDL